VRIKLDEKLPVSLAALVADRGHDTDTVLSEGLLGEGDPEVATAANAAGRMLITLDKGFGDIRAHPPGPIRASSSCGSPTSRSTLCGGQS